MNGIEILLTKFNDLALTIVMLFPIISALIILIMPSGVKDLIKSFAYYVTLLNLFLSAYIFMKFDGSGTFQYEIKAPWSYDLGISYHVGIDGISLFLLLITTFFVPIALKSTEHLINKKEKTFYSSLLLLEGFLIGSVVSLDMFLFYIFWELMLIPVFLMIGIWGESKNIRITIKFFIYTMIGSLGMLFSLLYLYYSHYQQRGYFSFDLFDLYSVNINPEYSTLLFFMFLLAFAIKAPLFPFHTWLPDTYTEAPVSATLVLSAVMAKLGVYGMIRFVIPLFPNTFEQYLPLLMTLAVIGTIYGGLIAIVQKDTKRLIAYSSISHLGYIILGVFAFNLQSLQGSVFHMVNHALSTGALFLLVAFLEERIRTRKIGEVSGLMKVMPVFGTIFILVMFSSIGLPGLNGFVGELLIFLGVFGSSKLFSALGATGIIIGAVYMLWMFQRVMFGNLNTGNNNNIRDLKSNEAFVLVPICILIVFMGVYPKPFLSKMENSISKHIEMVNNKKINNYNYRYNAFLNK